ncbi:UNC93-like protein [Portunus trituberculatus]|uniref:UNC93-like protein n=1 Tax=Portunus trituberculatus TaxID=210409 RepID=A0A5B7KCB8_PORTR|nr:UNC93-like protein [Portunus trituberculatus]
MEVGSRYADIVGENSEVVIVRFFGIFFLFFQSTQVWGNLIASAGKFVLIVCSFM